MRRIQLGDQVVVITGVDKGKRGKVSRVLPESNRVVVEGVGSVKRHLRATPQRPGGILEVEAPIHASKVMLVDPETGKRVRVRHKVEDGKKQRVAANKDAAPITPEQG